MLDLATHAASDVAETLNLVQIEVDVRQAVRYLEPLMPKANHERSCADKGLLIKTVLTESFGSRSPRPFRIHTMRGSTALIVGYTTASAEDLRDTLAMTAKPGMEEIFAGEMRSRAMPTAWRSGMKVGFETTFAPVVRVTTPPTVSLPDGVRGHVPKRGDEIDVMQFLRWRIDEIVSGKTDLQAIDFEPVFGTGWRERMSEAIQNGAGLSRVGAAVPTLADEEDEWGGDDILAGSTLTPIERCRLAAQAILTREEAYASLLQRRLRVNMAPAGIKSGPKTDRLVMAAEIVPGTVRVTRMMRETVWRPDSPKQNRALRRCTLPVVEMRGVLQIADGEAFSRLLRTGVGPHGAYGYGMLTLGPA